MCWVYANSIHTLACNKTITITVVTAAATSSTGTNIITTAANYSTNTTPTTTLVRCRSQKYVRLNYPD